jgi:choline dehydrogenase-like flavoprotein
VFPEVPRANTNVPTIAAAERLSDLIRGVAAEAPERERVAAWLLPVSVWAERPSRGASLRARA